MATATRTERQSAKEAVQEIKTREQQENQGRLGYLWANYALSIVMGLIFLVTFLGHTYVGWLQYVADQTSHGQTAELWGPDGYWVYFGEWTLQNWQSEFLQIVTMIVLATWFIHKGSPESKDSNEEMHATLARIESRLQRIESNTK